MKSAIVLLIGGMLLALAAFAQEPVTVCVRAADGSCVWVDQSGGARVDTYPSTPVGDPWQQQTYPPVEVIEPVGVQEPAQDSEVWIDWESSPPPPDPSMKLPGVCAHTSARARARFEDAMLANDINKIIEIYDWKGKTSAQAQSLVDRLDAIPRYGGWETSVMSGWFGDDPGDFPKEHWRWVGDGEAFYFDMRKVSGCWFLTFGTDPGPSIRIRRQQDEPPHSEPIVEEPGVYQF